MTAAGYVHVINRRLTLLGNALEIVLVMLGQVFADGLTTPVQELRYS